jgi:thiol-disulfide isomerase/thioredoxin
MTTLRIAALSVGILLVATLVYAWRNPGAKIGGAGQTPVPGASASLPIGPAAPEFTGITGWLNSGPLTLSGLAGKVVLVDFWTYSCINCQRTFPQLRAWWHAYRDEGLVIVGVHSPEFDFEKDPANVERAVGELGVEWPVALDPEMATWNAYQNLYWPADYLIDQQGRLRDAHFGEGDYDVTEAAIRSLLGMAGPGASPAAELPGRGITAEAYAGSARADGRIRLSGPWSETDEYALSAGSGATAEISVTASRVYLVAGSEGAPVSVEVTIDGRPPTRAEAAPAVTFDSAGRAFISVGAHDLYPVLALPSQQSHVLKLAPAGPMQLFTFTFG